MADFVYSFLKLLSGTAANTPPVPTDQVIPSFIFDDQPTFRAQYLNFTSRFEDVLDAEKLQNSLWTLLETGNWRKLGGRLRTDAKGRLEIHVPEKFTPERPPFRYNHSVFDSLVSEHPIGKHLPSSGGGEPGVRAHFLPTDVNNFLENEVTSVPSLINSDVPQIGLHIVSFSDSTLVSLSWPHTMTDAMGFHDLYSNWSRVLAGEPEMAIDPFYGFDEDPAKKLLALAGEEYCEPYAIGKFLLGAMQAFVFIAVFLFETLWYGSRKQHMICFPANTVAALKRRATSDLTTLTGDTVAPLFVSEGDVIEAALLRIACSASKPSSNRPLSVLNTFTLRGRVPGMFATPGAHVQNLTQTSWTFLRVRDVMSESVGALALRIRRSLAAQVTAPQSVATVRHAAAILARGQTAIYGESARTRYIVLTNMTKAKFCDVTDFGPAVIARSTDEVKNAKDQNEDRSAIGITHPGKPSYLLPLYLDGNIKPMMCIISGKDQAGNYWILAPLTNAERRNMDRVLAELEGSE